ncbi:exodeoxyribonuclease VII large subunit [Bradyrhizobium elkanii]|uniref:exodeoxyribonuclease VII large subunit n=1 Tax=Bradyrhizobium elkanii TaxID=29448 RepID=UPI0015C3DE9B|nr:exodeoxyribonuclease VII large subunit [Bradyrhizobium elkanii]NWL40953.1 exodeoxyribonuclease VII large subunit [Bradyrhizobium elkanii]
MTAAPNLVNAPEFTVSELSSALKRTVEDRFGHVRVRGEISGFRGPHSSGHCYFALKDESAKIEAVIWKFAHARMRFKPQEGLEVIATGKLTTYPNSSKYQIVIDSLEPAGVGALMALMEERKKKLAAEGLFDEARKQLLPWLPEVIGVVTSPTGAVIRDILHRLEDRFPRRVLVWPVKVQGDGSAEQVAAAIRGFNALPEGGRIPRPDLLIVARGGGSLEDLWSFNEEIVVRAAAHELLAIPRQRLDHLAAGLPRGLKANTHAHFRRFAASSSRLTIGVLRGQVAHARQRLTASGERITLSARALLHRRRERFSGLEIRLKASKLANAKAQRNAIARDLERTHRLAERARRALVTTMQRLEARVAHSGQLLSALSYRGVLARGFALVRDAHGHALHSAAAVGPNAGLSIEFADGRVAATANADQPPATVAPDSQPKPQPREAKPAAPKRVTKPVDQGSLF